VFKKSFYAETVTMSVRGARIFNNNLRRPDMVMPRQRGRRPAILLALLTLLAFLSLIMNDEKGTPDNVGVYGESVITIYSPIQEFAVDPIQEHLHEWSVEPPLPEGVRIFNSSLEIHDEAIDALGNRVCVITSDAGSLCWWKEGDRIVAERRSSEKIEDLGMGGGFVSITTGANHSCAIHHSASGQNVLCWGSNWHGQTGAVPSLESNGAVLTSELNGTWTRLDAGRLHTCGINEFQVYCWGNGIFGQLGNGRIDDSHSPMIVPLNNAENIINIESGSFHTCALSEAGNVYCWGWNGFGQLGDGTHSDSSTPVQVILPNNERVVIIDAGETHNCALTESAKTYCWGSNSAQQISSYSKYSHPLPITVFSNFADGEEISLGTAHSCIISKEAVECIGTLENYETPLRSGVNKFASGNGFFCTVSKGPNSISCDEDDRRFLPPEANSISIPTYIPSGRIAGIVSINKSSSHNVFSNESESSIAEFSLLVEFGRDSDFDGWPDLDESNCATDFSNSSSFPTDSDSDGICDFSDSDDDNDGFPDDYDSFPTDSLEWKDNDGDGIGSNSDSFEFTMPIYGAMFTSSVLIALAILEAIEIRKRAESIDISEGEE
jgi:hypothetical protein